MGVVSCVINEISKVCRKKMQCVRSESSINSCQAQFLTHKPNRE